MNIDDGELARAIRVVRRSSQAGLKEECLRQEWAQATDGRDKDIIAELVTDDEFWQEVKAMAQQELSQEVTVMGEEQFRQMFKDFDSDGSGSIDAGELQKLLQNALGLTCSDAEVQDMMRTVDADGSGEIDENEFIEIMNAARRQQEESARRADQGTSLSSSPRSVPASSLAADMPGSPGAAPASPVRALVRRASMSGCASERRELLTEATAEQYKALLRRKADEAHAMRKFT